MFSTFKKEVKVFHELEMDKPIRRNGSSRFMNICQ